MTTTTNEDEMKRWTFKIKPYYPETHDHEQHKKVARRYADGLSPRTPVTSAGVEFVSAITRADGTTEVTYSVS
jgi:hypothetical protein